MPKLIIYIIWFICIMVVVGLIYESILLARFIEAEGLKEAIRLLWEGSGK